MGAAGIVLRVVFLLSASQAAQPAPPTGLILGRVVDGTTNRPVAGAIVALDNVSMVMPGAPPRPAVQPRAVTNASGQFVFRKLPKGSFGLTVTRSGYAEGAYGRRRPGGSQTSVDLEDGQRTGDVVIRLWKHGSIAGTIVDEAGEPLIGVQVRAFTRRLTAGRRRLVQAGTASTDDRGVYRFSSLVSGDYLVAFVSREVSMPLVVADVMRTPAGSTDPKVQEMMRERNSLGAGAGMGPPGTPSGFQVGGVVRSLEYSAPVTPPSTAAGPVFIYPTQFFPGVASAARAAVITIESGQQRENVDFTLRPARAVRVSGLVAGPGGPAAYTAMRLVPIGDEPLTELETSATMAGPAGEFTFLGVPAGQYSIRVLRVPRPPPPAARPEMTQIQTGSAMIMTTAGSAPPAAPPPIPDDPTMFADVPLAVADADVTDVVVMLEKGARVTGRLEFDGTRERPDPASLSRIPITLERTDAAPPGGPMNPIPSGRADDTGAFKTYGLAPGKYLLRMAGAPPGWTMKSAISEGRDISDTPVDLRTADLANVVITLTDRPTRLTGIARSGDGKADRDALIVVFPADPSGWSDFGLNPRRLRSVRPSKDGAYTVTGLPAGDYYVAAIRDEGIAQWQDPQFLEDLSRSASSVRLADGETRTQDLRTPGPSR